MWCTICSEHLSKCTCDDIEERLEKLANHPNLAIEYCNKCKKHHDLCKCEDPESIIRTGSKFKLIRNVPSSECHWLSRDHLKGEIVYEYYGHTYGCLDPGEKAFSSEPGETPFFQLPADCMANQG